jgi:hypothetical protein
MGLPDAIPTLEINLTIVNVIQATMRVPRIIYNQGTTQAITILGLEMAVVPERPLR